jgi:hypothetical protein
MMPGDIEREESEWPGTGHVAMLEWWSFQVYFRFLVLLAFLIPLVPILAFNCTLATVVERWQ